MSELPIIPPRPHEPEELVLVGFRLDGDHDGPQCYTLLIVGGDNERPIMAEGRLLFFSDPKMGAQALSLDPTARFETAPLELETFCDVAETLHLVNSQDLDPDGVVLDCLLVFDDLVRATRLHMPDSYQAVLTELTARLTEGARLGSFLRNHSVREEAEDALLWCIGAITVRSRIVSG